VPTILKSGSLKLLESSGPIQACVGIALAFTVPDTNLDLIRVAAHLQFFPPFKVQDKQKPEIDTCFESGDSSDLVLWVTVPRGTVSGSSYLNLEAEFG
jgi:hypothetical protein